MAARRKALFLILPAICFLLVATSLYLGREHLDRISLPFWTKAATANPSEQVKSDGSPPSTPDASVGEASASTSELPTAAPLTTPTTHILSEEKVKSFIDAILDPAATQIPRLECPTLDKSRYGTLVPKTPTTPRTQYFFAIDLRNVLDLLPRLLGSVIEVARFLGPDRCAISIVEGNSPDGTAEILHALQPHLRDAGIAYSYVPSDINPSDGDRIGKLAELRNLALEPLFGKHKNQEVSEDTTVIFLNDVAACPEDILELVLQRRGLNATMTCAMDWTYVGRDPTFYDVWVARGMNGDSFFNIPEDGSWDYAWNLFWNAPDAQARLAAHRPFQVFSCWNGAVVFSAGPLLDGLRFRAADGEKGECNQGEPQLFCKDLWFRGQGRIAVVPTVNLEYSDEAALKIKKLKGYTSNLVAAQTEQTNKIDWKLAPPETVKCMDGWAHQFWQAWNETLG